MVMFDVIESGKYGVGSVIAFLIILTCLIVNGLYYFLLSRKGGKVEMYLKVSGLTKMYGDKK